MSRTAPLDIPRRLGRTLSVPAAQLLVAVEDARRRAAQELPPETRASLGQFMTPVAVSMLMATMFRKRRRSVHLLDAGAGVGSLLAAFVSRAASSRAPMRELRVTAVEVEPALLRRLRKTLRHCAEVCERAGIAFSYEIVAEDFIRHAVRAVGGDLLAASRATDRYDCAILNPPYRKIRSDSDARTLLREIGVETSNLYTAFVALAVRLLARGGEMVAITPRSFCNGPYFRPFRRLLLTEMALRRVHVFHSRKRAFREDEVLQENVIHYSVKGGRRDEAHISSSAGPDDPSVEVRKVPYGEVVRRSDPESFIHLPLSDADADVSHKLARLASSLDDLGIEVSTGRVVDFRAKSFLRGKPSPGTVPLIYPSNLRGGVVEWPGENGKKPKAILVSDATTDLLVPRGHYVLVKRFSAKEERRRIVAAVCEPSSVRAKRVGFENHLNYFHEDGGGLPPLLARGLARFLNSSIVDVYFRQFSGHTQVNATDLRSLPYPNRDELCSIGMVPTSEVGAQEAIDSIVEDILFS